MILLALSVLLYLVTFAFGFLLFDLKCSGNRSLPLGGTLVTLL